ncbi:hypothetical protein ACWGMW_29845 [Streptomyces albidoflavus]
MRLPRTLTRRPRPAALLAAGAAVIALGALGTLTAPGSTPDTPRANKPSPAAPHDAVETFNDGFKDGVADAIGDDNRDGQVTEGESGWSGGPAMAAPLECEHNDAPDDVFTLCLTVAAQRPYAWTNPDGSTVGIPEGTALIRDLDEKPGSPEWADALQALSDEYDAHAPAN